MINRENNLNELIKWKDENVYNREFRSLEKIADNYPKHILTLDTVINGEVNGVKIVNIIDWLLD